MKILLFSSSDTHGSYEYAHRMAKSLFSVGHEVGMMVKEKTKSDNFIIAVPQERPSVAARVKWKLFGDTTAIKTDRVAKEEELPKMVMRSLPFKPDLVIVGMINGFINTKTLAAIEQETGADIYFITADMAPLTGGCHYAWDCTGFERDCSDCPAILDTKKKQRAAHNLAIKSKYIAKMNGKVLAGSGWMLDQARRSALFRNQKTILNTNSVIDTSIFNNHHREIAKSIFGLDPNHKVVMAGARYTSDVRKGVTYLVEALQLLWEKCDPQLRENVRVMVVGENATDEDPLRDTPFAIHFVDYIKDYRLLSLAYQASDVFACPSIQDGGPMMVSEALACGTPVVGFEMGVVSNMVVSGYNGYKARLKDSQDFAEGLLSILSLEPAEYSRVSNNAVAQVLENSSFKTFTDIIDKLGRGDQQSSSITNNEWTS